MSTIRKTRKLILHPILFFKDRERKQFERLKKKYNTNVKSKTAITAKTGLASIFNGIPVSNINLKEYEVALYFFGNMGNKYQIEQWFTPLRTLNESKKIVIIVRNKDVFNWLNKNTSFTAVFCRTIEDLTYLYETNNIKCILYVNHGFKNFQSLIVGNALHVHINHGESDKVSTITNQSKAYDYVFVVGQAAYDKYNFNLIKKEMSKFISIGRPQLDAIEEIPPFDMGTYTKIKSKEGVLEVLEADDELTFINRKVILYAPTWEGTHESMNFTSLNNYGMSLVQQLLNNPEYYLVYKPHPNTGSRDSYCKKINNEIIKTLNNRENGENVLSGDINSLFKHIDLAIFDNSAVAIDYLQIDKPMIMTDMFHRIRGDYSAPKIIEAARMVSGTEMYSISMIIEKELNQDTKKQERDKIRQYFLGEFDYSKQESTNTFVSKIHEIIVERDMLLNKIEKINNFVD